MALRFEEFSVTVDDAVVDDRLTDRLAGWIVEKFRTWSDCDGDVECSFTKDRLLENISVYWITGTINSSTRMYYETIGPGRGSAPPRVTVPFGHSAFSRRDLLGSPRMGRGAVRRRPLERARTRRSLRSDGSARPLRERSARLLPKDPARLTELR